jgi:hypothetical protein
MEEKPGFDQIRQRILCVFVEFAERLQNVFLSNLFYSDDYTRSEVPCLCENQFGSEYVAERSLHCSVRPFRHFAISIELPRKIT